MPNTPTVTGTPVGKPVGSDLDAYKAKKLESQKKFSRWLDGFAGALLVVSGVHGFMSLDRPELSVGPLERVVFFWLTLLGMLIVAAEFKVSCIEKHIAVLNHRSGRAIFTLLAASLCGAAAPRQVPVCSTYAGAGVQALVSMRWNLVLLALLLVASGLYNLKACSNALLAVCVLLVPSAPTHHRRLASITARRRAGRAQVRAPT